jgi:hypothetical protein
VCPPKPRQPPPNEPLPVLPTDTAKDVPSISTCAILAKHGKVADGEVQEPPIKNGGLGGGKAVLHIFKTGVGEHVVPLFTTIVVLALAAKTRLKNSIRTQIVFFMIFCFNCLKYKLTFFKLWYTLNLVIRAD